MYISGKFNLAERVAARQGNATEYNQVIMIHYLLAPAQIDISTFSFLFISVCLVQSSVLVTGSKTSVKPLTTELPSQQLRITEGL